MTCGWTTCSSCRRHSNSSAIGGRVRRLLRQRHALLPGADFDLRGQYSHNTGVLTNGGSNGGFETAHADNIEQATVATAMQSAGYTTGLFGKYLNGYPNTVSPAYIPPGWDSWASASKGNPYSEYNYTLNQNGSQVRYGDQPQDYGTDVYVGQAQAFISQAAQEKKPFFIYLAVYAPHQPATPAPQDTQGFPGLQAPRDPSFNETDVSDKPAYIAELPLLTARQQRNIDNLYRRRAQSLQDVDRSVAALVNTLQQSGELSSTYIIFTSDNGFHLGQHRMPSGKQTANEPDIHLPLLVRGPGITAGSHVPAIAGTSTSPPPSPRWAGHRCRTTRTAARCCPSWQADRHRTKGGELSAGTLGSEHRAPRSIRRRRTGARRSRPGRRNSLRRPPGSRRSPATSHHTGQNPAVPGHSDVSLRLRGIRDRRTGTLRSEPGSLGIDQPRGQRRSGAGERVAPAR